MRVRMGEGLSEIHIILIVRNGLNLSVRSRSGLLFPLFELLFVLNIDRLVDFFSLFLKLVDVSLDFFELRNSRHKGLIVLWIDTLLRATLG